MAALSALAAVAQGSIPAHAQEAAQKAILQADLERTRLDYERSRMIAEDNRQKWNKGHGECMAIMRYHVHQARLDEDDAEQRVADLQEAERDNLQYIDHLRNKKRKLKLKYKNLCNETDKEHHDVCFLEHTVTNDTEEKDRKKFLRRWLL